MPNVVGNAAPPRMIPVGRSLLATRKVDNQASQLETAISDSNQCMMSIDFHAIQLLQVVAKLVGLSVDV